MLRQKYTSTNTLEYSYFHRIVGSWRIFVNIRTAYGTGNFNFKVKKFLMDRSWFRCSELVFLFFLECLIFISVVSYVFGGQLMYETWDSFADFTYGIFSLSLFYLYIRILSIKLQWIKRFQDTSNWKQIAQIKTMSDHKTARRDENTCIYLNLLHDIDLIAWSTSGYQILRVLVSVSMKFHDRWKQTLW